MVIGKAMETLPFVVTWVNVMLLLRLRLSTESPILKESFVVIMIDGLTKKSLE